MNSPLCRFLEWDTNHFGFRIGRVQAGKLDPGDPDAIDAWCDAERIRCLYLLAESADAATAKLAADRGFRFVDIRLTLAMAPPETALVFPSIRPAREQDLPVLAAIARSSHTDSRFHFDGQFPPERCDGLYETWIRRSCQEGYADVVLVAVHDSRPAGYVTCSAKDDCGQIGLIAVADQARGSGHGSNLIRAALQWFYEARVSRVKVVTQGRNVQAQRLYQRCGFLTSSVELWYHRWFPARE
jgi:dTDP-4-amino-4,6-dideoxy-D-galactose acyltransferase